jgi:hypothetical protein
MKHGYTFFFLLFLLGACSDAGNQNSGLLPLDTIHKLIDSLKRDTHTHEMQTVPTNLDSAGYSRAFLSQFLEQNKMLSGVHLHEGCVIIGNDTTFFPDDLPLYKELVFKGLQDEEKLALFLKRINYTTLEYRFEQSSGNAHKSIKGRADLNAGFFLGAETDTDDLDETNYLAVEYFDYSEGVSRSIRVGRNEKNQRVARFHADEKGLIHAITTCPTLREK